MPFYLIQQFFYHLLQYIIIFPFFPCGFLRVRVMSSFSYASANFRPFLPTSLQKKETRIEPGSPGRCVPVLPPDHGALPTLNLLPFSICILIPLYLYFFYFPLFTSSLSPYSLFIIISVFLCHSLSMLLPLFFTERV